MTVWLTLSPPRPRPVPPARRKDKPRLPRAARPPHERAGRR